MGFPQQPPQQMQPQQVQSQQSYQASPEEIQKGHQSVDAVMDGLISLVSKPKGELTKKDVFDASSDMIAKGAFPTPESKQQLIGQLANLPDQEDEIRKALGNQLLQIATFRNHMHNAFGPPQEPQSQLNSPSLQ